MTEAHHAAVTHDQVEAGRRHGQDDDAGEQRYQERLAADRRIDRQNGKKDQQRGKDDIASRQQPGHLFDTGNRPSGRSTKHDRHQQIDQHRRHGGRDRRGAARAQYQAENVGQKTAADRIDQADQDRGNEGAADRADAADDDHHEGENEDVLAHADLHRQDRRLHQSGEPGERGAQPEYQRIEQLDVDAECADHFAVGGAGADQHADTRAHHQDVEKQRHQQRHQDDGESGRSDTRHPAGSGKCVLSQAGSGTFMPAGPQISRTTSLKNRISPKVPST